MSISTGSLKVIKCMLREDEGYEPYIYDDATGKKIEKGSVVIGNPTMGIGWAVNRNPPSEASEFLRIENEIREIENILVRKIPCYLKLCETRKIVLINMAYQLGVNGLLKFNKMLTAAADKDWKTSAIEMMDSDWAKKHKIRANKLNRLWENGDHNGF